MTRTVFCQKLQQELEGLDRPPYPGPKGQEIFDTISKQAWQAWQKHQTLLINEKGLSMMNPADRAFLQAEMDKYMSGQDYAQAEGYVPEQDSDQTPKDK
jgi:Fe-S cluster biosynthesis and repair protein YggX